MVNRKVALLLRIKAPGQQRRYLKPALAANGKIRPLWAVYNDQPTYYPHGIYYLRYKQGRKLVFDQVGSDLAVAQVELLRRRNLLEAKALGNVVEEAEAPVSQVRLDSAINLYLDEIAARRSLRIAKCYSYVLELFRKRCQREYLDELSRADMVTFTATFRRKIDEIASLHSAAR
jgi:hypothetical protein